MKIANTAMIWVTLVNSFCSGLGSSLSSWVKAAILLNSVLSTGGKYYCFTRTRSNTGTGKN